MEVVEKEQTIGIGLLNMQGKSRKGMEDLERAVKVEGLDVLCLVETHSRKEDRKGPSIEGFVAHQARREGTDKKGGGLAILVRDKKGIAFSRLKPDIKCERLGYVAKERMWLTYESQGGKTAICCVYMGCQSSDGRHDAHNAGIYEVLSEEVYTLRGKGFRVIMKGDFNAWVGSSLEQGGIPGNRHKTNSNGEAFKQFLRSNNYIHVNGACRVEGDWTTRITTGLWTRYGSDSVSASVLDYVVVTTEHLDSVKEVMIDEKGNLGGDSDHNMVVSRFKDKFVVALQEPRCKVKEPGWDFDEDQDWTKFKEVVEREMLSVRNDDGVELLDHAITTAIVKGLEEGVGRRQGKQSGLLRVLPKHIVAVIRERRALEKEWKTGKCSFSSSRSQTPPDSLVVALQKLKDKGEEVDELIRAFERQNRAPIKKIGKKKTKRGRQMFWKYVSRKHQKLEDVSALQNKRTGVLKFKPEGVSEEIFGYLKEIFAGTEDPGPGTSVLVDPAVPNQEGVDHDHSYARRIPRGSAVPGHEYAATAKPHLSSTDESKLPTADPGGYLDKDFTEGEVKDAIKGLGNEKASGHDFVPNEGLKNAPSVLIKSIVILFNRVKNKGEAPKSWKRGRLVLIHKKGSRTDAFNYRPLTVLTAVSGLYTKLLNNRLTEVVEAHGLLGEIQNGFRKTRSGGGLCVCLEHYSLEECCPKEESPSRLP